MKNRSHLTLVLAAAVFMTTAVGSIGCGGGGGGSSGARSGAAATTSGTATPTLPASSAPTGTFERTYAGRVYELHVPASHDGTRALPVVLAFHGSGDTAKNFFETLRVAGWITAAEQAGVILVVPSTKSPYQTFPVWSGNPNNDLPQMQTELTDVLALLDQDVATTWRVDPARVHGLGFSDGGLFLGAVGLASPRLATCTILSYGWGAFDITPIATRRPVHLACGTADQFFNGAQQTQAFVAAQGHDTLWEPVANVGHTIIGLSAAIQPSAALTWLLARPPGTGATPTPTPGAGSGGTGGARGLSTRTITTVAQGGVPSVTVNYDVFVPSGYAATTPISVVFAANMGLQPWQALAQAETFIVVDLRDHDRNGGWRFDVDVLVLDAVLQDVDGAWNVNTKRRYFHGFSAAAHWGYAVVMANANLFAGLGISAGSMQTAIQQGVWPNGVARKLPVAIRHGTTDTVVPVAAGRADRDRLMLAAHPVELSEFAGGHTVSAQDAQAIWAFLRQHSLP